jgi:hypothetical protein
VLDRLERPDRHAELVVLLHVFHGDVEDPAAGADRGGREAGQGQVGDPPDQARDAGTAACLVSAGTAGSCFAGAGAGADAGVGIAGSRDVRDVPPLVERAGPLGGDLCGRDDPDAVIGQERDLAGPVRVEDILARAVEHAGARARVHAGIVRAGTACARVVCAACAGAAVCAGAGFRQPAGRGKEPGRRGQEGRRIRDVAEFLHDDGQLDRRCLQPAQLQVGRPLPGLGQVPPLGEGLPDRLPQQPLILVELKLHGWPPAMRITFSHCVRENLNRGAAHGLRHSGCGRPGGSLPKRHRSASEAR